MAVRPQQPKVRLKDRRRRAWALRYASVGILVIAIIAGAWYVVRLPALSITTVRVEGTQVLATSSVQTSVESELAGSYLFFFPKRLSLIVPTGTIEKKTATAYPQIATIKVRKEGANTLVVAITERGPAAIWCKNQNCYDMDASGYIFMKNSHASSTMRIYEGSVPSEALAKEGPVGTLFLNGVFPSLEGFIASAEKATNRHITKVTIGEGSDVFATFAEGGELRFVMTTNTAPTLQNISSVFSSTAFQNGKKLEYADFRFGNRAEVKFAP